MGRREARGEADGFPGQQRGTARHGTAWHSSCPEAIGVDALCVGARGAERGPVPVIGGHPWPQRGALCPMRDPTPAAVPGLSPSVRRWEAPCLGWGGSAHRPAPQPLLPRSAAPRDGVGGREGWGGLGWAEGRGGGTERGTEELRGRARFLLWGWREDPRNELCVTQSGLLPGEGRGAPRAGGLRGRPNHPPSHPHPPPPRYPLRILAAAARQSGARGADVSRRLRGGPSALLTRRGTDGRGRSAPGAPHRPAGSRLREPRVGERPL